jgi:hypothetical protein
LIATAELDEVVDSNVKVLDEAIGELKMMKLLR